MNDEQIAAASYFVAIEDSLRPGDRVLVVNNVVVAVQHTNRTTITDQRPQYANGQDLHGNPHWGAREYAYGTPESAPLRIDMLRAIHEKPGWLIAQYLNNLNIDPKSNNRIAARGYIAQMKRQGLVTHAFREDAGRARQRLKLTAKGTDLLNELSK